MPVLLARRADARSGQDDLRSGQGPPRLEEPAASLPRQGEARRARPLKTVFTLKGSEAFWKFHDTAFKNQKDLGPESYEKWAVAAGVDAAKFKAGSRHQEGTPRRSTKTQQLANKVGANGTPAFRINGAELSGAQPFDKFKELIDKELQQGSTRRSPPGTPKDKIYVEMSKENFKAAPQKKGDDDEGEKEDDQDGLARAGRQLAHPRQDGRARHDHRVLRLPVPVLQARGALAARRSTRPTATRFASCGSTSRFRSTRVQSPPRSSRSRLALRRATQGFWAARDKLFEIAAEARGR